MEEVVAWDPKSLAPSWHQRREDVGWVRLEHRESLWAPRSPPSHPGWAQVRDGTPRTSWGTLLSPGGAPGRGLGRGQ